MAKETQKAKIERLERELSQAQEVIKEQNNKIDSMIDKADNDFENSVTYKQMLKQIETLELKVKSIMDSVEHNRQMYENEIKVNEKLNKEIKTLKEKKYMTPNYENLEIIDKQLQQAENEQLRNVDVKKLNMNANNELEQLRKENAELKRKLNAGRKEKFSLEQQEQIKELRKSGKSMQEIAGILKCSKATIFNYLKKFNNK